MHVAFVTREREREIERESLLADRVACSGRNQPSYRKQPSSNCQIEVQREKVPPACTRLVPALPADGLYLVWLLLLLQRRYKSVHERALARADKFASSGCHEILTV
jgi:hypothetical protein